MVLSLFCCLTDIGFLFCCVAVVAVVAVGMIGMIGMIGCQGTFVGRRNQ